MKVRDVYKAINAFAPFMAQESWDNSGILVGGEDCGASRVLVTLDISPAAVEQAELHDCDVIVSHHPVIFTPLKRVSLLNPVYDLCRLEISAICCHTPLDLADGGLNDLLAKRLSSLIAVREIRPLLIGEPGRLLLLAEPMSCAAIARIAKEVLGCTTVRYAGEDMVTRLGICTGSGASLLEASAGVCDCLLTGDVKHDRWYKAQELGMGLIDCGHYHTEVLMVPYVAKRLREALPGLEVIEYMEGDPASYV